MLNWCLNIVSRHKVIVLMVWLLKILKTDGHDKYKYCENDVRTSMYLMSKYLKTLDLPHHPRPARAQWCRRGDLLNVIPSHKISSPRPRTEDRGQGDCCSAGEWPHVWAEEKSTLLCLIRFNANAFIDEYTSHW